MGAWGTGAFENDDAADWVWELTKSNDESVLSAAFAPAASDDYLEAPQAAVALAAAEVVAALKGHPGTGLSDDLSAWVARKPFVPAAALVQHARAAVARVAERSELQELWEESDDYDAWKEELTELLRRLQT